MKKLSLLAIFLLVSCAEEVKEINAEQLVVRQGISYEVNSNTPFTGSTVEYYENGQLAEKGNYVDGEKEGRWIEYWKKGQLKSRINYENNVRNGLSEYFWTNGELASKGNLKNDILDGYWEYFTTDGKLAITLLFKNGDETERQETEYLQQYEDDIQIESNYYE